VCIVCEGRMRSLVSADLSSRKVTEESSDLDVK